MGEVNAIVNDANAMLAQMRLLSQEAAGSVHSVPAKFSRILEQVMNAPEQSGAAPSLPVVPSTLPLTQQAFSADAVNRVYHAAIHAYQEIENMQI